MNETERRAKAEVYEAINWNEIEDNYDKQTWEKLNSQFWTATRVPVSNDLDDWRTLDPVAKDLYGKVFGGLTLLDTLQSQDGMLSLLNNETQSPHMRAVLSNMLFMEAIHAQSYSTIFSTLMTPQEITNVFDFTHTNEHLQKKAHIINEVYQNGTVPQKMIASVFLESGLFYSGFYTPLYYLGNGKMANVAEVIRLILRDESVN
ncbi:ribonucleotide reductase of class Ib (aerobic) beta subunit [Brochothrix phage BtpYZU04]